LALPSTLLLFSMDVEHLARLADLHCLAQGLGHRLVVFAAATGWMHDHDTESQFSQVVPEFEAAVKCEENVEVSLRPFKLISWLSAVLCHLASPTVVIWCPVRKSRMPGLRHASTSIRIRQAVALWPFQGIEPLARVERAGRRAGTYRGCLQLR
jgi:hypothetical protein